MNRTYAKLCVEVDKKDCLLCEYGEIAEGEYPPFPICANHIVILQFILDKAQIHNWIIEVKH